MTEFALEPIFGSTFIVLLIATIVVSTIVVTAPHSISTKQRRALIILRVVAALVLLLVAFGPSLIRSDREPAPATVIVIADQSESMTLGDGNGGSRWETQNEVWQRIATETESLDATMKLQLLTYAGETQEVSPANFTSLSKLTPDGNLTDIAAAIEATFSAAGGVPVAGVILIGDGMQTAEVGGGRAQRNVATLNSIGVPLWSIPIGPEGNASESRDLAVSGLADHLQLFAGNTAQIDFEVVARGFAGRQVPVTLTWIDSTGKAVDTISRTVTPTAADQVNPMSVPVDAPKSGVYRLQVEVAAEPGELLTNNNRQISFVEVRDGGGRILYLEGQARWEKTFLSRALRRFPDLQVTDLWIPSSTINSWPARLDSTLGGDEHDIYLIGDLDASALGDNQLQQIADAVDQGAGLLMIGGLQNFAVGGYGESPLAKVLPVLLSPRLRRKPKSPADFSLAKIDEQSQITDPITLRPIARHPITSLVDLSGDNQSAWQGLPAMPGATRFDGPKRTPGTQVLLESQSGQPMLVVGEYGRGRTAAVAFDSTYKWSMAGQQESHNRFWRQLTLWLLSREINDDDAINIQLTRRRFNENEIVAFEATKTYSNGATPPKLTAEVIPEGSDAKQQSVPLSVVNEDGTVAVNGELKDLASGIYRLKVSAENGKTTSEVAFQVTKDSRELSQAAADPFYLKQLADSTAAHGGRSFRPDEIDELIRRLTERRASAETTIISRSRLGDGPISGWIIFLIFTIALGTEWTLRRKWNLP